MGYFRRCIASPGLLRALVSVAGLEGPSAMNTRPLWLAIAGILSVASVVRAEPRKAIVLPVTRADERLAEALEAAHSVDLALEAMGIRLRPMDEVSSAFERAHSREPNGWSQTDVDHLAAAANQALHAIVAGNYGEAMAMAREARERADGALEALNRKRQWSMQAFETCALEARTFHEDGDRQGANDAAFRCLVLYPGFTPSKKVHPLELREIFSAMAEQIQRQHNRPLQVESTPPGCAVLLNGRLLGTTPYRQNYLSAYQPRVQVECAGHEGRGRVHTIAPGTQPAVLNVDTEFEAALHTDAGSLRLVYPQYDAPLSRAHVLATVQAVGGKRAITLSTPSDRRYVLTLVGVMEGRTVSHEGTLDVATAQTLVERLLAKPAATETDDIARRAAAPKPIVPVYVPPAPEREPPPERSGAKLVAASGVSVGAGIAVTGWSLYHEERRAARNYELMSPTDSGYLEWQHNWMTSRRWTYGAAGTGSALMTLGGSFIGPILGDRMPRWVRPVVLSIGGALGVSGVALMAAGARCPESLGSNACVGNALRIDTGAVLLLDALPFLLSPAAWWLHERQLRAFPSVEVTGQATALYLQGKF
jgi:hypothetical protein